MRRRKHKHNQARKAQKWDHETSEGRVDDQCSSTTLVSSVIWNEEEERNETMATGTYKDSRPLEQEDFPGECIQQDDTALHDTSGADTQMFHGQMYPLFLPEKDPLFETGWLVSLLPDTSGF